jgi:hypothetical protein
MINTQTGVFFVRTKDGSEFGVYDVVLDPSDVNKISFAFGSVDNNIQASDYANEVQELVDKVMNSALQEYIAKEGDK